MKKILISIKPEHVKNIINGTKKFEYRTKVAKGDINKMLIYSSFPEKKIIAEAEIISILAFSPKELWEKTKDNSGISKRFFDEYFLNRKIAYAYEIGKIKVFKYPKKLIDFGVNYAPQSYIYLK